MTKKTAIVPVLSRSEEEEKAMPVQTHPRQRKFASLLGFWFFIIIAVGAVIVIIVSSMVGYWLHNVQVQVPTSLNITNPVTTPVSVTTFKVDRSAPYAGLDMKVVSAQYATLFNDDLIRPGSAIVRLNMQVTNHTTTQINVVYYTIARLLASGQKAIVPTNVHLSVGPKTGTSENGWIDFAVSQRIPLNALTLQLGSTSLGESMVNIPLSGNFNVGQYADKVLKPGSEFDYSYMNNKVTYSLTLNYHLTSLEIREAYQGSQARAGQRFYIFNFRVDNQNTTDVIPGFGYDYIRMLVGTYARPPIDNTLPNNFKAGKTTNGRVVFIEPVGIHNFSMRFLYQTQVGSEDYPVTI